VKPTDSEAREQRLEATTVIANIFSSSDLAGFRILTAKERESTPLKDLSNWDVVWKAEDVLGMMRVTPRSRPAAEFVTEVIDRDSRRCGLGRFASTSRPEEHIGHAIRLTTTCELERDSWSFRYLIAPRGQGDFYFFGIMAAEAGTGAAERADARLRAALIELLKR
jgi:hypothetical protein